MSWPASSVQDYVLRLFVTGTTMRSQRAISNIRNICDAYLAGHVDLEVIDVYLDPERTRDFQIVATPTLVRLEPNPLRRIVGDLSDHAKVLASLNIPVAGEPASASS